MMNFSPHVESGSCSAEADNETVSKSKTKNAEFESCIIVDNLISEHLGQVRFQSTFEYRVWSNVTMK